MKTFRYRLYPSRSQQARLLAVLEECRYVYNTTIEIRKQAWEQNQQSLSKYDTNALLPGWKQQRPSLTLVYAQVLQQVQERVDLAFQAFFRRVKRGEKPGYPRFKGKDRYDSFTFPQDAGFKITGGGNLKISKIGVVKMRQHRPLCGRVKRLTIHHSQSGEWHACFSVEVEETGAQFPESPKSIGIDLGLSHFATLSDGEKVENPRFMKQDAKDIARLQRKLQRSKDKERESAKKSLSKVHRRVANRRRDFSHQLSRKLVDRFDIICLENLQIQKMAQCSPWKTISRGIADVAWGRLVQNLCYKAEDAGKIVVLVNPKNTTQTCSNCGNIVPKDLSVRVHECQTCGLALDRDENAARNVLRLGLQSLQASAKALAS